MPNLRTANNRARRAQQKSIDRSGWSAIPEGTHLIASGRTHPQSDMDRAVRDRFSMISFTPKRG